MLIYLETRISDTFGWSQDVLHKFDYVLCSVHTCMHEHEINYVSTFISTGWKFFRARTNVVTFECSFVLVTFVSRFYATKHSLDLIMHKIGSNFM